MTQLLAYPGGEPQKLAIIAELEEHAAADRLVKGRYWKGGKGCAVGCTIKSGNHVEYEPRFGIPQALARLEDSIFENLPNAEAMRWPVHFMRAAPVGADLSLVQWQFLAFVVEEALSRRAAAEVRGACRPALEAVRARARGEFVSAEAAESAAESAAWSARSAAWSAARSAAWSAAWSAAESAAESAAWSAAESAARSAAWSAWSAAESAAWSAAWSAAESAAAESAAWKRYAAQLLELVAAAPVAQGAEA